MARNRSDIAVLGRPERLLFCGPAIADALVVVDSGSRLAEVFGLPKGVIDPEYVFCIEVDRVIARRSSISKSAGIDDFKGLTKYSLCVRKSTSRDVFLVGRIFCSRCAIN